MHQPPPLAAVLDLEPAQLLPPQAVIEQRGQDGPVPLAFEGLLRRRLLLLPGLVVGQGRRFALVASFFGPLHPVDRVVGDGMCQGL